MTFIILVVCAIIFFYIKEKIENKEKITPKKDFLEIVDQLQDISQLVREESENYFAKEALNKKKELESKIDTEFNTNDFANQFKFFDFNIDASSTNSVSNKAIEAKKNRLRKEMEVQATKNIAPSTKQVKIRYKEKLKSMELPTFEKIRRYCNNLVNENNADSLHIDMAKNGKMHKARLYSAFDKLFEQVNNEVINIIDYNCGQAIDTSILLEYIKEKQLNIEVSNIVLIDYNTKALSRASLHVDVLKSRDIPVKTIQKGLNDIEKSDFDFDNQNIIIHLFSNIFYGESLNIDNQLLGKIPFENSYFVCISPKQNDKRVDAIYNYFDSVLISSRDNKIGRFSRYEKIFLSNKIKVVIYNKEPQEDGFYMDDENEDYKVYMDMIKRQRY
jgi:hypothetical protein